MNGDFHHSSSLSKSPRGDYKVRGPRRGKDKNKDEAANRAERDWPREIRLVYDGGIKMDKQHSVIKAIIKETICGCECDMIMRDAFLETGGWAEYSFDMAREAIKSLQITSQYYQEAYRRAKRDGNFVSRIGEVVRILSSNNPI